MRTNNSPVSTPQDLLVPAHVDLAASTVSAPSAAASDSASRTRTHVARAEPATASAPPAVEKAPLPPAPAGYELIRELGIGGMGAVYLAEELATERQVAIKFLQRPGHQAAFERFLIEVRALALLDHPNIIRVLSSDFLRSNPYFTTEYAPGGCLLKKLEAEGPLDPQEAALLIAVVSRAIHAAHSASVIHRDLKPSNIVLMADGSPKVSDFGLAKRLDRDDELTTGSGPLGSPPYMAPEQTGRDEGGADARTDVYGLGATLYHLVTGKRPFSGMVDEVIRQVQNDPPVPPRSLRREVPRELEAIILKCMEKDPARRYQTAEALAIDLDRFHAGQVPDAPLLTWPRRVRQTLRRNRKRIGVAVATAVAMVAVAVIAIAATRPAKPVEPPDPIEEIRKELAAGNEVQLVRDTGLPRFSRFPVEPGAVGDSELGDKTAAFHSFYDSLVELCPAPGINRYRVSLELRQLQSKGVQQQDGTTESDYAGFYFGHAVCTVPSGTTVHAMFALTYSEVDRSAKPGQPPSLQPVFLRRYGLYQNPNGSPGERKSEKVEGLRFSPKVPRPGLWRPVVLEVAPGDVHLQWQADSGKMVTLARWTEGRPGTEYEKLKASLNEDFPGAAASLPAWSPNMPFGLLSRRSSVAFRKVVITPLP